MTHPHAIDREEPLFEFDSFEEGSNDGALDTPLRRRRLASTTMSPLSVLPVQDMSSFAASTRAECTNYSCDSCMSETSVWDVLSRAETLEGKGKGASRPLDIQPRDTVHYQSDIFSFSLLQSEPSSFASTPQTPASFTFFPGATPSSMHRDDSTSISYGTDITTPASSFASRAMQDVEEPHTKDKGKGKAQEAAPCLPPLSFSLAEFSRGETNWPIAGSTLPAVDQSSNPSTSLSHIDPIVTENTVPPKIPTLLSRMPSRRRSLSSLSTNSGQSLAAKSISRIKVKLGKSKATGSLARKLMRNCDELDICPAYDGSQLSASVPTIPRDCLASPLIQVTQLCLMAKQGMDMERNVDRVYFQPSPCIDVSPVDPAQCAFKHKNCLHPPPLLQTIEVLDFIPTQPSGFSPVRLETALNLFDSMLPKELKLAVLNSLLTMHRIEHERAIQSAAWTAMKASSSKARWVGRDKGIAELVKLSRVSKSWQRLVFDGQLWAKLDLRSFPIIPANLLLRLASTSGRFVRSIDLTGHSRLSAAAFSNITKSISNRSPSSDHSSFVTQLTDINMSGCSSLNTYSLHELLLCSPSLLKLCLKGSTAVTNSTCETLANSCRQLVSLDLNHCQNIDADGILSIIRPYRPKGHPRGLSYDTLPLKELRIAGLRHVNDEFMIMLGKHTPLLEVLDLSGVRELHNSAIDAFVSCPEDEDDGEVVVLTSKDAGRDPNDSKRYRRRITRLRHLSLSSCPLLSDIACSHLAHTMPRLEFFELAGIGSELKDDGLVRLLNTTPLIRRLDLEEACDITDVVLRAITPLQSEESVRRSPASPTSTTPGTALEHLVLSYAANLTNDAVLDLIRGCARLRTIELDNTRVSGAVIKEFVRLSRRRQIVGSEIVAIDCRGVGDRVFKELTSSTRTRKGWRSWEARKLGYLDGRDEEGLDVGQDECDEKKVAVKTFYSWQTVEAVEAAREKRRKANKRTGSRSGSGESYISASGSSRWWTPGGNSRRSSTLNSPTINGVNSDREGCIIM